MVLCAALPTPNVSLQLKGTSQARSHHSPRQDYLANTFRSTTTRTGDRRPRYTMQPDAADLCTSQRARSKTRGQTRLMRVQGSAGCPQAAFKASQCGPVARHRGSVSERQFSGPATTSAPRIPTPVINQDRPIRQAFHLPVEHGSPNASRISTRLNKNKENSWTIPRPHLHVVLWSMHPKALDHDPHGRVNGQS
ncbi:hypothetical protein VDGL01_04030 [Verticillium dahliae]